MATGRDAMLNFEYVGLRLATTRALLLGNRKGPVASIGCQAVGCTCNSDRIIGSRSLALLNCP